jgi:hypothetical protein
LTIKFSLRANFARARRPPNCENFAVGNLATCEVVSNLGISEVASRQPPHAVRAELEAGAKFLHLEKTTGADGKVREELESTVKILQLKKNNCANRAVGKTTGKDDGRWLARQ